jgi:hypothetical protein
LFAHGERDENTSFLLLHLCAARKRGLDEALWRSPQLGVAFGEVGGDGGWARRQIPAHAVHGVLVHGGFGMRTLTPGFLNLNAVILRVDGGARIVERAHVVADRERRPRQIRRRRLRELEIFSRGFELEALDVVDAQRFRGAL